MANKRKINGDLVASANINNNQKILRESQEVNICNEKRKRISNSPTQSAFQEKRFSSAPNDLSFLNDLNDLESVIQFSILYFYDSIAKFEVIVNERQINL